MDEVRLASEYLAEPDRTTRLPAGVGKTAQWLCCGSMVPSRFASLSGSGTLIG